MWTKADALPVLEVDQELLEHLIRSGKTPQKLALRARILLGAAEGKANYQLSEELNVSRPTILLWRQRYLDAGLAGVLKDAPRPGRKQMLTPEKVDATGHPGATDSRLRTPRHHHVVRGPQHPRRHGDWKLFAASSARRVPEVPGAH